MRSANASEKDARAALYGAVKRVLSPRDVVLLDSLNYIKGWRYQLHCEAKAVRTPSVVVQVGADAETAKAWNERRLVRWERRRRKRENGESGESGVKQAADCAEKAPGVATITTPNQDTAGSEREEPPNIASLTLDEDADDSSEDDSADPSLTAPYSASNFSNLVFRYEEPNPMARWDSPLFVIVPSDTVEELEATTFPRIWDALVGPSAKLVRPNQATERRVRDVDADYLYMLDRETQDVVAAVAAAVSNGQERCEVPPLPADERPTNGATRGPRGNSKKTAEPTEAPLVVELPVGKSVSLAQLQRHRRAFIGLNRGGIGLEGVGNLAVHRIRENFVAYLNDAFERRT